MISEDYIEYGILIEPTNYTNAQNHWEMGWLFTVGDENINVGGLRVKFPVQQTTIAHLWDSKGNLLDSVEISAIATQWTIGFFQKNIELIAKESYIISCYNSSNRYYSQSDKFTFNDKIQYGGGRYIANKDAFPENVEPTSVYPMIDIVIDTTPPYDKKYLIYSDSTFYTIADNVLSPLSETELSVNLFKTYGVETVPEGSFLTDLINPEILYWHDSIDPPPKLKITVTGVPPVPQTIITSTQDMSDTTILGIEGVQATCSDDILFAISFDDEVTWKAYDGTSWATLDLPNTGMTKATMENIGLEAWAEIVTSDFYKFRFILPTTDSYLTSLVVNYIN